MLTESAFWVLLFLVILFGLLVLVVGGFAVRSYLRQSAERAKLVSKPVLERSTPSSTISKEPQASFTDSFWIRLKAAFPSQASRNEQLEVIEEVLYTADLGPQIVEDLLSQIEKQSFGCLEDLKRLVKENLLSVFDPRSGEGGQSAADELGQILARAGDKPFVLLVVGVNGVGKTTTIGKLAQLAASCGKKVLVAAGDTFRAAAAGQLKVWADRAQVEIFNPPGVTDPGAVAFDAVQKAKARDFDLVLIDTAGRLHTQSSLMAELEKIKRVLQKADLKYPHETWIVLDANTGQNGVMQAREFSKVLGLTGAVLTKMDGTAKGGVVFAVQKELGIPIKFLGVGEKQEDLICFSPTEFVEQIFENKA